MAKRSRISPRAANHGGPSPPHWPRHRPVWDSVRPCNAQSVTGRVDFYFILFCFLDFSLWVVRLCQDSTLGEISASRDLKGPPHERQQILRRIGDSPAFLKSGDEIFSPGFAGQMVEQPNVGSFRNRPRVTGRGLSPTSALSESSPYPDAPPRLLSDKTSPGTRIALRIRIAYISPPGKT